MEQKQITVDEIGAIREVAREIGSLFQKAAIAIGNAFYSAAESDYLRHHRRLPGSDKTPRMRKKRISAVMRWYADQQKTPNV